MKTSDPNAQLQFAFGESQSDCRSSNLSHTNVLCFQSVLQARRAEAVKQKEREIFQKILRMSKRYKW